MKERTYVSGSSSFNNESLEQMKSLLKQGKEIYVGIACLGHTKNNMEQEAYKQALTEYFGDNLIAELSNGLCSYSYSYHLKEVK